MCGPPTVGWIPNLSNHSRGQARTPSSPPLPPFMPGVWVGGLVVALPMVGNDGTGPDRKGKMARKMPTPLSGHAAQGGRAGQW